MLNAVKHNKKLYNLRGPDNHPGLLNSILIPDA
jgi:hypothetical protein